ncbi:aldo/keto reductase [uncultured Cohaesibacter sp.]|uniref:aldo/keto reductase n=1 Tax=uncultured Cohaesibacter sp. TaxID=1002546 RepID=UPI00292E7020|nr:aldo/keto reductase [uncultured Cohaesibacter sp.]
MTAKELVLGTANLGMAYGTAIKRHEPDHAFSQLILGKAMEAGITRLDSAAAYGNSEDRIGDFIAALNDGSLLCASTKTPPYSEAMGQAIDALVTKDIETSCQKLRLRRLPQVLLHRWCNYAQDDGLIWACLQKLKAAGKIGVLGASVQSPAEMQEALKTADVEAIQLACNLLDWRYDEAPYRHALIQSNKRIEVRSVFLQGLLTLDERVVFPTTPDPYDEGQVRAFLKQAADRLAGGDLIELCLRFARGLEWADAIVVGADSPAQIEQLVSIWNKGPFSVEDMNWIRASRPRLPVSFLDPAKWS